MYTLYRCIRCIVCIVCIRCIALQALRDGASPLYRGIQQFCGEGGCEEVREAMTPQHHPAYTAPPGTSQHHPTPLGALMVPPSRTSSHPPSRQICCIRRYSGLALSRAACSAIHRIHPIHRIHHDVSIQRYIVYIIHPDTPSLWSLLVPTTQSAAIISRDL